jgi:hypothetical protein
MSAFPSSSLGFKRKENALLLLFGGRGSSAILDRALKDW